MRCTESNATDVADLGGEITALLIHFDLSVLPWPRHAFFDLAFGLAWQFRAQSKGNSLLAATVVSIRRGQLCFSLDLISKGSKMCLLSALTDRLPSFFLGEIS